MFRPYKSTDETGVLLRLYASCLKYLKIFKGYVLMSAIANFLKNINFSNFFKVFRAEIDSSEI